MKRRRSPQEKKRLSLKKDFRETYGESDKGARKTVPKRKAKGQRQLRRGIKAVLDRGLGPDEDGAVEAVAKALDRKRWRKVPGTALGELVKTGPERHAEKYQAKRKRRLARDDFEASDRE